MSDQRDDGGALERRARELFDASVAGMDAATRSRLNQARQAALAELARPRPWGRLGAWAPAGALAAAALVGVALWLGQPEAVAPDATASAAFDEFELVADADNLPLLDDDPEFYAWAAVATDDQG